MKSGPLGGLALHFNVTKGKFNSGNKKGYKRNYYLPGGKRTVPIPIQQSTHPGRFCLLCRGASGTGVDPTEPQLGTQNRQNFVFSLVFVTRTAKTSQILFFHQKDRINLPQPSLHFRCLCGAPPSLQQFFRPGYGFGQNFQLLKCTTDGRKPT